MEKTAVDVMNEALGVEDAVENDEEIEATEDDEAGGSRYEEGDEDADSDGEESAEDGDDDSDGDEEADADTDADEEGEPDAAAAADKGAKPDAGKKKPDPINDPIPKDLKKETSERIRSLISTTKEVTAQRDAVQKDFDTVINGIADAKATPEQYGELLGWVKAFNSPEPAEQQRAYQLIENVAERMAEMLGIDRKIGDPFEKYPDIKLAIEKKEITPQMGRELARMRSSQGFRSTAEQQQRQQQQQQEQRMQAESTARNALSAIDKELSAKDPLYAAKKAQVMRESRNIIKMLPFDKWPEAYREAIKNVRLKPKGSKPNGSGTGMRARTHGGAGTGKKAPSTMLEALEGALRGK